MNYKTHRIGGLCSGYLTLNMIYTPDFSITKLTLCSVFLMGSYVGSIIPDIDHPNSYISKKMKLTSKITTSLCDHRGFIHSPLAWLLFTILTLYLTIFLNGIMRILYFHLSMGLSIGYLSHLILDSLTIGGIPMLYPISKDKIHIAKFKTNKHEFIVSILCITITMLLSYLLHI